MAQEDLFQNQLEKCKRCRFAIKSVNPASGLDSDDMYCIHPEHGNEWIWQSMPYWNVLTLECSDFEERT